MKLFIDSADYEEIKQAYDWGIADGVTTNPSLMKKAVSKMKTNWNDYIKKILRRAKGTPVSLEVTSTDATGMIAEGKQLYKMFNKVAKNVVIKIPVNPALKEKDSTHFDGITAIRALTRSKIPVNCTLVFTPEQALLAAKAGASFVSPFAGRIDDLLREDCGTKFKKWDYYPAQGHAGEKIVYNDNGIISGIDLVDKCVRVLKQYNMNTQVLAASVRNVRQVRESAIVGADIATIPLTVMKDLIAHPKTFDGMAKFNKDVVVDYAKLTHKESLSRRLGVSVKWK
tara:strand:- start:189 stop:1040 length:852 start_codon:yes stop_codon:yes gene_type:complete